MSHHRESRAYSTPLSKGRVVQECKEAKSRSAVSAERRKAGLVFLGVLSVACLLLGFVIVFHL